MYRLNRLRKKLPIFLFPVSRMRGCVSPVPPEICHPERRLSWLYTRAGVEEPALSEVDRKKPRSTSLRMTILWGVGGKQRYASEASSFTAACKARTLQDESPALSKRCLIQRFPGESASNSARGSNGLGCGDAPHVRPGTARCRSVRRSGSNSKTGHAIPACGARFPCGRAPADSLP